MTSIPTDVLKVMKENRRNVPSLKWQYVGSEEGVFTLYPAVDKPNMCGGMNYDPRIRYVSHYKGKAQINTLSNILLTYIKIALINEMAEFLINLEPLFPLFPREYEKMFQICSLYVIYKNAI